ncbi:Septin-domain-containing protein [Massariosphaeria phaeospora]|uniref:Septin-domain-containing protein n=1 Tax=Massariosphaeria phaeospora TaxID=100035 RepID=A0A7C8I105_9PLEO|nr:Septin-domain-containing protein [Massariosphaeria phaeospora]
MRPSTGGDALPPRSRKSSLGDHAAPYTGPSSVPTAFFLRSEEDIEQNLAITQRTESGARRRGSTFGVQSLADTLEGSFGPALGQDKSRVDKKAENIAGVPTEKDSARTTPQDSSRSSSINPGSSRSSPARNGKRKATNHTPSAPLTSFNIEARSPATVSAVTSTPKSVSLQSLKLSDDETSPDEAASQVVTSSGDEEDEDPQQDGSLSFPQLVMPSLQMPTRRPFTDRGKAMGKLKVLVTGESGIGKSCLIRSIVQLCEHIVHVDPLSPSQSFTQSPPVKPKSRKRKGENASTTRIIEINASTKSYPHWWTDIAESHVSRRRKSTSDAVLERNICFVDTPGFKKDVTGLDDINLVVDYVESLLFQTSSITALEDNDVLGVVSGTGGVSVDLVVYLLSPSHDISKDIDFMERLSALTNVIPVIAKSDTISVAELATVKTSILARLQTTSIRPFFFGKALDDALIAAQGLCVASDSSTGPVATAGPTEYPFKVPTHPYALSSVNAPDSDTMDASLLMSPDYVQPLLPSELAILVNQIFDPDSIAWLRHSAAKKFLSWRHRTRLPGDSYILQGLQEQVKRGSVSSTSVGLSGTALNASGTSSIFSATSPSGVLVPRTTSPFFLPTSNFNSNLQSPNPASSPSFSYTYTDPQDQPTEYTLARYNSYVQGEHRPAELRLAKWATDLQRSLRNERERYEELQRADRAKWLLERVGEEVRCGSIMASPTGSHRADWAVARRGTGKERGIAGQSHSKGGILDSRDPLGLCDFGDDFTKKGFVLIKVMGGMSVLGALVVAVVKACGVETGLPEGGVWSWVTGVAE